MFLLSSLSEINIYDEDAYAGNSIIPFLGFCLFVASIIIIFLAVVNIVTIKKDFKIFYDSQSADAKPDDTLKKKGLKKNTIILIVGIVLMIVSRLMTYFG